MTYNKTILLSLLFFLMFSAQAVAVQPADEDYQVIRQASAECGPTTTWLMLNHYYGEGAIQSPEDPRDRLGYHIDSQSMPEMFAGYSSQFFEGVSYEDWVELLHANLQIRSLRELAERLESVVDPFTGMSLFHVSRNEAGTRPSRRDVEARDDLRRDLRQYLDQGVPSVIHLARPSIIPGHYVTLVGYGTDDDGMYYQYIDTVQPEEGILRVSHDDLASGDAWYTEGFYNAHWNGRYLNFWPRDLTVIASVTIQALQASLGVDAIEEEESSSCNWLTLLWGGCS